MAVAVSETILGKHRRTAGRSSRYRPSIATIAAAVLLAVVPVVVPVMVLRGGASTPGAFTNGQQPRGAPGQAPAGAPTDTRTPSVPATALTTPTATATPLTGSIKPAPTPAKPAPATTARRQTTPGPTAAPGPDLVVISVSWSPSSPRGGDQVMFTAVVRNKGNKPTPTVTHGVAFMIDGDTVTWSGASSAPLGAGETRTYTADESDAGPGYWIAVPGAHQLGVWADDVNRIPETTETNNILTVAMTVS
jgi:hypothetical protein